MTRLHASEYQEQVALMHWAKLAEHQHPELRLLFSIPNGGLRNKIVAAQLKRTGTKAGVPDLCLPIARCGYHSLWIELKAAGGKVSVAQRDWIYSLQAEGHCVQVCVGWEIARHWIEQYLALPPYGVLEVTMTRRNAA